MEQRAVDGVGGGRELAERTRQMLPTYLDAAVIAWVDGQPMALTGTGACDLPGPDDLPLHIVTACNPEGRTAGTSRNEQLHARLLREVDQRSASNRVDGRTWWPAVGSSADGRHAELSVALAGLARSEAVDLGRRHGQLAIFELTDRSQVVVPCIADVVPVAAPRDREEPSVMGLDLHHLSTWWDGHVRSATIAGVTLPEAPPHCPSCGSGQVMWTMHGLPLGFPPPWVAIAGCIVGDDDTELQCGACGWDW